MKLVQTASWAFSDARPPITLLSTIATRRMEHRDESYEETSLQRQQISRHRGRRQDHVELREKSNHLLARRRGRFCLLHTGRQGQGHRSFRSGEGSGGCHPWQGRFFRRGLLEW